MSIAEGVYLVPPEGLGIDRHSPHGKSDHYQQDNGGEADKIRITRTVHQAIQSAPRYQRRMIKAMTRASRMPIATHNRTAPPLVQEEGGGGAPFPRVGVGSGDSAEVAEVGRGDWPP